MKHLKKTWLTLLIGSIILTILAVAFFKHHHKPKNYSDSAFLAEESGPRIDYFLDSTLKVVVDTLIDVYQVKTGKKISSMTINNQSILSMAMHPSGSHLLVLDEYALHVYDLKKDNITNIDTTKTWSDNFFGMDITDMDYIEFTEDGKYLMVIDYKEAEVMILQWPGLKELTSAYMGGHRNSFWWDNEHGKLVFYYKENEICYRTVFPSGSNVYRLHFSKPTVIKALPDKFQDSFE
jgi:hypothetical protein